MGVMEDRCCDNCCYYHAESKSYCKCELRGIFPGFHRKDCMNNDYEYWRPAFDITKYLKNKQSASQTPSEVE